MADAHSHPEAIQAFGDLVDRLRTPGESRRAIYDAVLAEVAKAAKAAGLPAEMDPDGGLAISWMHRPSNVQANVFLAVERASNGSPAIVMYERTPDGPHFGEVPLRFDHVAQCVTGVERDTSIAPVPGEPIPYRNAAAVVAEHVVARLRDQLGK